MSNNLLQRAALGMIRIYQLTLANYCWGACRFYPTCSNYAKQAISKFGLAKGLWLTIKRLGKCHPWCQGGYDPIVDN